MHLLTETFANICGQGRCFVIDGTALPVCQRCLGLYVGAAITGTWLAISGIWRRGLPARSVALIQIVMLLAAMLGGLHLLDLGARWRLLCGLWTGHVTVCWLVGATVHLWHLSRPWDRPHLPWTTRSKIQAAAVAVALTITAAIFPRLQWIGWNGWTIITCAGAAMLLVALLGANTAVVLRLIAYRRRPGRLVRLSPHG